MEEKIEMAKMIRHLTNMGAWATDPVTADAFDLAVWTIIQTTKED